MSANTENRDPYAFMPYNRVELRAGDHVRIRLPYSEAMMACRQAGQVHLVRVGNSSAQLIDVCGREWGAPYLPIECGILGDGTDAHPYYTYGVKIASKEDSGT
jgi:hypothetical protein